MMYFLYHSTGSQHVELVSQVHPDLFGLIRRQVVSTLRMYGSKQSADLLEHLPFELWKGTNGFGDEFELLYLRLNMAKINEWGLDGEVNTSRFTAIARTFEGLQSPIRFIAIDPLTDDPGVAVVTTPTLATSSAVVQRALKDFETLVREGGAVSGVDRIHTALHGHLLEICRQSNISHAPGADITALFNFIRQQHPKFQNHAPGTEPQKMFRGLAQVVDAMNPVRNQSSMAHPNPVLLDEPEAMLAANAVRSLLHYLNMKLS
jgi:Abortive infection C-terminus